MRPLVGSWPALDFLFLLSALGLSPLVSNPNIEFSQVATFSSWIRGSLVFYYSSDKTKAAHELALENYGTDGTWVILVKA
mmetsp:Transcript_62731/g.141687  ORF Transcript_62731/g.141687 Transcript_62731/m.141687 type:complete len:80 (-) Transcript_62731:377-616(-)